MNIQLLTAKVAAEIVINQYPELRYQDPVVLEAATTERPWQYLRPWLVRLPHGHDVQFDSENEACEFLAEYRKNVGLNEFTGVKE